MPYPPDQARAIAISYRKRRKKIPVHVGEELSKSLRGRVAREVAERNERRRKHKRKHRRRKPVRRDA